MHRDTLKYEIFGAFVEIEGAASDSMNQTQDEYSDRADAFANTTE